MGRSVLLRGRQEDFARLRAVVEAAESGAGSVVSVEGDAGVGKTTLLAAIETFALQRDIPVWRVKAEEFERKRPFGALRRLLLPAGLSVDLLEPPTGVAGAIATTWVDRPEVRFRAADTVIETVQRTAADAPLVILIDDGQWVDEATIAVLEMLVRRLSDRRLVLLLACRLAPWTPVFERFLDLVPSGGRLVLEPLDETAVRELVGDALGKRPSADDLRRVRLAAGNPFFVLSLLADPRPPAEVEEPSLPAVLRRAVRHELDQLGPATRQLLPAAAVLGGQFSATLLAAIACVPIGIVAGGIDEALQARVLRDDDGVLSFRHDLVREVVYSGLSPAVRSSLHRHVGEHLMARHASASDVALHFVRSASPGDAEASRVLRRAAAEIGTTAPATATDLLEQAVSLLPDTHPDHLACETELVQSYVFSAALDRSSALADELLARALPSELELGLRNARSQVFFLRGYARRATSEFEAMAPLVRGQPGEAVLLADAAVSAMFAIDLVRSRRLAALSLDIAAAHDNQVAPGLAHGVLSWLTALEGDVSAGVALAQRAIAAAARAPGLQGHRRIPHLFHAQALLWADRVAEAQQSLQRGWTLSRKLRMGWDEPMYQALLADQRIRAGEWDDALAVAEAGAARGADVGSHFADGWLHVHIARVHLLRGQLDLADGSLARAEQALQHGGGQGADLLWYVRAMTAFARGEPDTSAAVLAVLWDRLETLGVHLRQYELAPDVVRVAEAAGDWALRDRVLACLRRPGPASTLRAASVAWSEALAHGSVERAREAIDLHRQRDHPLDLARCKADVSVLLHRTGHNAEAAVLEAEAQGFFRSRGAAWLQHLHFGAPLPAVDHRHQPARPWQTLTRSERNVAELVAAGLANAQIAERLSISPRTVESHLYHSYQKLGLETRVQLAMLAATSIPAAADGR